MNNLTRRITTLLMALVMVLGVLTLSGCGKSPLEQALEALEEGNFATAAELVEDNDDLAEEKDLLKAVKTHIRDLEEAFDENDLTAEEVIQTLEDMEDLLDALDDDDLTELAEELLELTSQPRTYKIGVAIYSYSDPFLTNYRQEMESHLKSQETDMVKYEITTVDSKNDMEQQLQQIDAFIDEGMDAIICNLVRSDRADEVIEKAVAADIPLILINREPLDENGYGAYPGIVNNPNVCYVGVDPRQSGTCQGQILLAQPDRGDINGDGIVKYVMIMGDPDNPDAQYRTEYSIKALTDAGVAVECLLQAPGWWDVKEASNITADALAQYGNDIDVIFCNNDGMAIGASYAVSTCGLAVGKDIYLLGIDGTDEVTDMVRNGEITGTVRNDYVSQAHTAADVVIAVLRGKTPENYYRVPYVTIDASYFD